MSIESLKARLPDHARDLRLNLGAITSSMMLTPQQAWGTALSASVASRNAEVVSAIERQVRNAQAFCRRAAEAQFFQPGCPVQYNRPLASGSN